MRNGIDVSRWQEEIDWQKCVEAGAEFVAIRATVGKYYTDPNFKVNWDGAKAVGLDVTAYHVVVPDNSIDSQMGRFRAAMGYRSPDLSLVLDCELTRNQTQQTITGCIKGCAKYVIDHQNPRPIIYTRASWFNRNVLASPDWSEFDLWIARYASKPWFGDSDPYKPRDWDTWAIWQYTNAGDGHKYGMESTKVDLNYQAVAPPPTLEERVSALELLAHSHRM